jgi:hypothetical protein
MKQGNIGISQKQDDYTVVVAVCAPSASDVSGLTRCYLDRADLPIAQVGAGDNPISEVTHNLSNRQSAILRPIGGGTSSAKIMSTKHVTAGAGHHFEVFRHVVNPTTELLTKTTSETAPKKNNRNIPMISGNIYIESMARKNPVPSINTRLSVLFIRLLGESNDEVDEARRTRPVGMAEWYTPPFGSASHNRGVAPSVRNVTPGSTVRLSNLGHPRKPMRGFFASLRMTTPKKRNDKRQCG